MRQARVKGKWILIFFCLAVAGLPASVWAEAGHTALDKASEHIQQKLEHIKTVSVENSQAAKKWPVLQAPIQKMVRDEQPLSHRESVLDDQAKKKAAVRQEAQEWMRRFFAEPVPFKNIPEELKAGLNVLREEWKTFMETVRPELEEAREAQKTLGEEYRGKIKALHDADKPAREAWNAEVKALMDKKKAGELTRQEFLAQMSALRAERKIQEEALRNGVRALMEEWKAKREEINQGYQQVFDSMKTKWKEIQAKRKAIFKEIRDL